MCGVLLEVWEREESCVLVSAMGLQCVWLPCLSSVPTLLSADFSEYLLLAQCGGTGSPGAPRRVA